MATIQFEKYNSGNAFRTGFYTVDVPGLVDDGGTTTSTVSGLTAVFAPTSVEDDTPTTEDLTVRSFEIYIDTTPGTGLGDDGEAGVAGEAIIAQRLAKVVDDPDYDRITNADGYDVFISGVSDLAANIDLVDGPFELTVENISGSTSDIRVVFVVDIA